MISLEGGGGLRAAAEGERDLLHHVRRLDPASLLGGSAVADIIVFLPLVRSPLLVLPLLLVLLLLRHFYDHVLLLPLVLPA
eukprot:CAMPEP_0194318224 /NCGR_PEP_ID=MMETSP0171-20130528/14856_1 /TAXON_ID=218684 /ORGANISM="Corethron pennatum, Strain L29A3" /LENGTH=80 /DNA_ID=CAMNT_0039075065 /DNA_START=36 /DNA_END=275 /DNA_ORIENTATION=-